MKNTSSLKASPLSAVVKNSQKTLMEKMGLSKKELNQVHAMYGVSASKLLE